MNNINCTLFNRELLYNEKESYKKKYNKGASPRKFAEKLAKEICSQGLPDDAPPSLFHAGQELKRLQMTKE